MGKIVVQNASPVSAGTPGSFYIGTTAHTFSAAGDWALPPGEWDIPANADISVQLYVAGAWMGLGTASDGLTSVVSDGASVQLVASAATSITLLQRS